MNLRVHTPPNISLALLDPAAAAAFSKAVYLRSKWCFYAMHEVWFAFLLLNASSRMLQRRLNLDLQHGEISCLMATLMCEADN